MLRKLLILGFLLSTQQVYAQKPNASTDVPEQQMGAPLPPFLVVTLPKQISKIEPKKKGEAGSIVMGPAKNITNKDVKNDANLFLMFFNPTCGHCEDMTQLLEKNIQLFHKTKVLMIAAPSAQPYLEGFVTSYNIDNYPTLMLGTDSSNLVGKLFLYKSLPQFNIYDKDRKLIKVFSGDTPIDSLKPYIQ